MKQFQFFCTILALTVLPLSAGQISIVSYSMQNGTAGGADYLDSSYDGSGCTGCSAAALSGGNGKLTDGFATPSFFTDPNSMVGWQFSPTITLYFAQNYAFGTLRLHLQDGLGAAGIHLPLSVDITAPAGSPVNAPLTVGTTNQANWYDLNVSGLSGSTLSFTLNHTGTWTFMGEVQVLDESPIPEPGTFAVAGIAALAGFAALRRRRA